MSKRLYISLIFNNLVVIKTLSSQVSDLDFEVEFIV